MVSPSGILVLDKPPGITSFVAVARVRSMLPRGTKVGHAGTLDRFATGVLLILIGKATRRCEELMGQPKRYVASARLGASTPTLDPDSPEIPGPQPPELPGLTADDLRTRILPQFVGTIQQVPPVFSALKQSGKRVSLLARKGRTIELEPRPVTIYSIDLLRWEYPVLELDVLCGRGTYIRALARDIAERLSTTAYLTALRRTAVGPYTLDQAATLSSLTPETLASAIRA